MIKLLEVLKAVNGWIIRVKRIKQMNPFRSMSFYGTSIKEELVTDYIFVNDEEDLGEVIKKIYSGELNYDN